VNQHIDIIIYLTHLPEPTSVSSQLLV